MTDHEQPAAEASPPTVAEASPPAVAETSPPGDSFGKEIDLFVSHVDAIGDALQAMVVALQRVTKDFRDDLWKFEEENYKVVKSDDKRTVTVPVAHLRAWKAKDRYYQQFFLASRLRRRSLLVSMVSQYDAYLGQLLRSIFLQKPEMLNASEKTMSFEELVQFASIEAAREHIIEKEVESILRSSHADQFQWMERTYKIPLTKDLASWPEFIEITERRNLFVHVDGVVSSQYLATCQQNKCQLEQDVKEGTRLDVPQAYMNSARNCVLEIGIKLGHVLWRKLFPDQRAEADSNLIRLTYEMVDHKRYELAKRLLDFSMIEIKKYSSEVSQLTLVVNRAQAYKWSGDADQCKKIMGAIDWSAKGDEFRLANAVLAEDWNQAVKVMKRIGRDGPVSQVDYRDWPLFQDWRKHERFLATYKEVFAEDFSAQSAVKTEAVQDPLPDAEPSPLPDLEPSGKPH